MTTPADSFVTVVEQLSEDQQRQLVARILARHRGRRLSTAAARNRLHAAAPYGLAVAEMLVPRQPGRHDDDPR